MARGGEASATVGRGYSSVAGMHWLYHSVSKTHVSPFMQQVEPRHFLPPHWLNNGAHCNHYLDELTICPSALQYCSNAYVSNFIIDIPI